MASLWSMENKLYHKAQAYHNEESCLFLETSHKFHDWVITTAFYSALHFCKYYIFPYSGDVNGNIRNINNFDQFCSFKNIRSERKHHALIQLIEDRMPEVSANYMQLMDAS